MATHVYMHWSPRCSVEIEVEKKLEKEEKKERPKQPKQPVPAQHRGPAPRSCLCPRARPCSPAMANAHAPTLRQAATILSPKPLMWGPLLPSPLFPPFSAFPTEAEHLGGAGIRGHASHHRRPCLQAIGHQCLDGRHVPNPWHPCFPQATPRHAVLTSPPWPRHHDTTPSAFLTRHFPNWDH